MIGYKAFNKDLICRDMQYEVGKTYEMEEKPKVCEVGYHFYKSIANTYKYYNMCDDTRICKVEALGDIDTEDDVKYYTNKIRIVEEITEEWVRKGNASSSSVGYCNTGDSNTGDSNTGNRNTGDRNTGYCNTDTPKVRMFNHDTDMEFGDNRLFRFRTIMSYCPCTYSDYISENNMSDKEKESHPEYKTIGGYIKTFVVTKEDKQRWWDEEVIDADKEFIKSLPYFDADIFEECTEIRVELKQ